VEEEEEREETIENKYHMLSSEMTVANNSFLPSHINNSKYVHDSKMVKNDSYLFKRKNLQPLLKTPSSFSDINSSSMIYKNYNKSSLDSLNKGLFKSKIEKSSHLIPLMTKCDQEVFMSQNLFDQQRKLRFKGNFSSSKHLINSYNDYSFSKENEKESLSTSSFITNVPNNQILSSIVTPNGIKSKNGLYIYNKRIILLLFLIFKNTFYNIYI
jgi:hypothetical protein